jgi:hypothetical protein
MLLFGREVFVYFSSALPISGDRSSVYPCRSQEPRKRGLGLVYDVFNYDKKVLRIINFT